MGEFQMISKKHEDLIDIEYHDGKQVRKKVDPLKEIRDELTPDKMQIHLMLQKLHSTEIYLKQISKETGQLLQEN